MNYLIYYLNRDLIFEVQRQVEKAIKFIKEDKYVDIDLK